MQQDLNTMLDLILEKYPDEEFLKADGFDEAILGVEEKGMKLIYSVKSCIDILIREGLNDEDAIGCKLFSQEENFHMQNYSGKYIKFLIEKCSDR